jgi:hypothetical protein
MPPSRMCARLILRALGITMRMLSAPSSTEAEMPIPVGSDSRPLTISANTILARPDGSSQRSRLLGAVRSISGNSVPFQSVYSRWSGDCYNRTDARWHRASRVRLFVSIARQGFL